MREHPSHIVAAMGVVLDSQGRVLLVRTHRREWEPPGGQIEMGEDLITGLQREIEEESGCQAEVNRLVGVYSNIGDPCQVIFAFLCTYTSGKLSPSDETPEVAWYSQEEALRRVTHPAQLARLHDVLSFSGERSYRVSRTHPYALLGERSI